MEAAAYAVHGTQDTPPGEQYMHADANAGLRGMPMRNLIAPLLLSVVFLGCNTALGAAPEGVYSDAQAARGKDAYAHYCADCHHLSLRGSAHGTPLAGPQFMVHWGDRSASELVTYIRTRMSSAVPSSASPAVLIDITAYILRINGAPAGDQDLLADSNVVIGPAVMGAAWSKSPVASAQGEKAAPGLHSWSGAGSIAAEAERAGGFVNRTTPPLSSVSDAMLANPPAGDWLNWRRTPDGQGYSPLDQVNRSNVRRLTLAWALTMREGSNQVTPLVHDGVMFLTSPGNVIQALDAATGELIWEYAYSFPPESRTLGGPTRNIAIYKDKLYLATYDAAIVALDVRTGQQVWRTVKADYRKGYTHTAGPVVADGVVISGINGCERFKKEGCFITGHDPDTGKELWRTSTIALPGDPNDSSVGRSTADAACGRRHLDRRELRPGAQALLHRHCRRRSPGLRRAGTCRRSTPLSYTNSTLALEPRTGRIVWYLPARARRDARHGDRLRARPRGRRRRACRIHRRQGRHPLEARPADRQVRGLHRNAPPEPVSAARSSRPASCNTGRTSSRRRSVTSCPSARAFTVATTGRRRLTAHRRSR